MSPPDTLDIILVEDNRSDARLFEEAMLLHTRSFTLRHFSSAKEVLQDLEQRMPEQLPDLIVSDLNLPGMKGHELLAALKQNTTLLHIPFIVLSTSSNQADIEKCYQLQASSYICKPDSFEKFANIARVLYEYWFGTAIIVNKKG